MENKTAPAMMPSAPAQSSVLASLKRNVLWGVLGLVALVFATVCVMYYTSRQSQAATPTEAPMVADAGMPALEQPTGAPTGGDTTSMGSMMAVNASTMTPVAPAPVADGPVDAAATAAGPAATPTTAPATTPAKGDKTAAKPDVKAGDKTTAKPVAKPVAKPTEKTAPAKADKTFDAENLPHGTKIYVVKSGDTMEKIARQVYGDGHKMSRLVELNKDWVKDINHLKVGQKLLVEKTINPRDYADY